MWDALRSNRPYRSARPRQMVMVHIIEQAGKHFDPDVVEAFLRVERSDLRQVVSQSTLAGSASMAGRQVGTLPAVGLPHVEEAADTIEAHAIARPL